jgi:hypothetical protein
MIEVSKRAAARRQRLAAFPGQDTPPGDIACELLCEDHVGTYSLPYLCHWSNGTWRKRWNGGGRKGRRRWLARGAGRPGRAERISRLTDDSARSKISVWPRHRTAAVASLEDRAGGDLQVDDAARDRRRRRRVCSSMSCRSRACLANLSPARAFSSSA